jgi:hypothetical protein
MTGTILRGVHGPRLRLPPRSLLHPPDPGLLHHSPPQGVHTTILPTRHTYLTPRPPTIHHDRRSSPPSAKRRFCLSICRLAVPRNSTKDHIRPSSLARRTRRRLCMTPHSRIRTGKPSVGSPLVHQRINVPWVLSVSFFNRPLRLSSIYRRASFPSSQFRFICCIHFSLSLPLSLYAFSPFVFSLLS